jgi:hypothetical protein
MITTQHQVILRLRVDCSHPVLFLIRRAMIFMNQKGMETLALQLGDLDYSMMKRATIPTKEFHFLSARAVLGLDYLWTGKGMIFISQTLTHKDLA